MHLTKEGRESKDTLNYRVENGLSFKWDKDDWSTKTKFANDKVSFEAQVKPADLNKDDMKFSAKHSSSLVPSLGCFETTQGFKFASPELGPMKFWMTVRKNYNTQIIVRLSLQTVLRRPEIAPVEAVSEHPVR